MRNSNYSKPGYKQAFKSLGFGALLFCAGIQMEKEITDIASYRHIITSFLILFGTYVTYTGIKELIQTMK